MVVKEYDYIKGNNALNPKRKSTEREQKKYEELKKSKKNRERRIQEQKKKNRVAALQIAIFILLMGLVTIGRDSQVFKMQKDLTDINREIKQYQADNEALEVDLLKFSSLDNIKSSAEEQLNMTMVTKDNIVPIDLSNNYFKELDKKDKKEVEENNKGFLAKILDALNI